MITASITVLVLTIILLAVILFRPNKKTPNIPAEPDIKFTVRYNGSEINPVDVLLYDGDVFLGLKCIYTETSSQGYRVVNKQKYSVLIDTYRFANIVECIEKAKEILIDTHIINHERATEIQLSQEDGPVAE